MSNNTVVISRWPFQSGIESTVYALRVEEIGDVMYLGEAAIGSSEASSVWRIKKIDSSSGVSVKFAGNGSFGYKWSQRLSLVYS